MSIFVVVWVVVKVTTVSRVRAEIGERRSSQRKGKDVGGREANELGRGL